MFENDILVVPLIVDIVFYFFEKDSNHILSRNVLILN